MIERSSDVSSGRSGSKWASDCWVAFAHSIFGGLWGVRQVEMELGDAWSKNGKERERVRSCGNLFNRCAVSQNRLLT